MQLFIETIYISNSHLLIQKIFRQMKVYASLTEWSLKNTGNLGILEISQENAADRLTVGNAPRRGAVLDVQA